MSFLKEAKQRWGASLPPFFKKLQLIGGAIVVLGTGLVFTYQFTEKLAWLNNVGPCLIALGAGMAGVSQFAMTVGTILGPGESLNNDSGKAVEVVVNPAAPAPVSGTPPDGLTVTKTGDKS